MRSLILSSLALAGLCAGASAAVNVTKNGVALPPPGPPGSAWSTAPTIQAAANDRIRVYADAGEGVAVTIDNVAAGAGVVTLVINSVSSVGSVVNSPLYSGRLYVESINATGDISNIAAHAIGTIVSANGNITGSITATDSTASTANPAIGIESIEATHGSIRATITCSSGRLGDVTASEGNIGTSALSRASITGGEMGFFRARNIYADINASGSVIDGLRATGTASPASPGTFVGSLQAASLAGGVSSRRIVVTGDLNANITLTGNNAVPAFLDAQGLPAPAVFVGGNFAGGALSISGKRLAGQVVFNGNNAGGLWSGAVSVNSTSVPSSNGGRYAQTPADLGGGAVGLTAFKLHRQGCVPASGSTVNLKHINKAGILAEPVCEDNPAVIGATIKAAYYGRIAENASSNNRVYRIYFNNETSDVSQYFAAAPDSSDTTRRTVGITPNWGANIWSTGRHEFRLRPLTTGTKLLAVPGSDAFGSPSASYVPAPADGPATDDDDTYVVTFIASCDIAWKEYYNLNGDGLLNMGDAVQWFTTPVDFNNDGVIDALDIAMQLNAISTIGDQ